MASCLFALEVAMPKGFDVRCGAGKTARVWLQEKGGALKAGQALVLLPLKDGETESSPAAYLAPLRQALIDDNRRHVNVVVCESDYRTLKRGIENLGPGVQ
jgi:hypothetical protein